MSASLDFRRSLAARVLRVVALAGSASTFAYAGGCGDETGADDSPFGPGGGPFFGAENQCFFWSPSGDGGAGGSGGMGGGMGGSGGTNKAPCPPPEEAKSMLPNQHCGVVSVDSAGVFSNGQCCYEATVQYCAGRAFIHNNRALTSAAIPGDGAWIRGSAPRTADVAPGARAILAEAWTSDALLEHASVASFARVSLELLAAGAPAELLALTHAAALDEVKHARACFGLATAYGGRPIGPSPFPFGGSVEVASDLAVIAARTVEEGCVGETLAAVLAAEQLEAATDPAVREALAMIAADEARHAELAWRIVAWAVEAGGERVRAAVEGVFDMALRDIGAVAETARRAGKESDLEAHLRAHGRLNQKDISAARGRALADVVLPGSRALLKRSNQAPAVERADSFAEIPGL